MKKLFLVIILIITLLLVVSCVIPSEMEEIEGPMLEIDSTDQACEVDDDCVMAMVKCSCDCGIPINKIHQQKYIDEQIEICENYEGKMCKMKCEQELECVDSICTIV